MDYLHYKNTENRDYYESKVNERRKRLSNLVLAEVLVNSNEYMDEIVNGLWLILEESTWVWPAHIGYQKSSGWLPDPTDPIVDLNAGRTSAIISWVKLLLEEKLTKLSPIFVKRIDYELNERIVKPFMGNDFWWMGFDGNKTNNWDIWINTNVVITSLLAINQTQSLDVIERAILSADKWMNGYGDDGGCDEGTSYWFEAGGELIKMVTYLTLASNNQMNWSSNDFIPTIGRYIHKMHINSEYFVNFADASAKNLLDPSVVLGYGQMFNDSLMKGFASYIYHLSDNESYLFRDAGNGDLHDFYLAMNAYPIVKDIPPKAPQLSESWLPDLQVITLRTEEGSAKGLFLGAKAGYNAESHNHNDVGNFVLYVNGLPAIIDVGVETYTMKTFGKHRYDVWTMQSQWHNTPTINGVQQQVGKEFRAHNVSYNRIGTDAVFEADIAGAYPTEAHVNSFVRRLTFNRSSNSVEMTETYSLDKFVEPLKMHFMTALNVSQQQNSGEIQLNNEKTNLLMSFDSQLFDVKVDKHRLTDKKLPKIWGTHVNRVTLISKLNNTLNGNHLVVFKI